MIEADVEQSDEPKVMMTVVFKAPPSVPDWPSDILKQPPPSPWFDSTKGRYKPNRKNHRKGGR